MRLRPLLLLAALTACALVSGCAFVDVHKLAADASVEAREPAGAAPAGRNNNTPGSTTARQYILDQIQSITDPVGGSYTHAINLDTNVVGVIPGTELRDEYVIGGAHN